MPFIGHREPDLTDAGLSPAATPAYDPDADLHARAAVVVERVAHDEADRLMLLDELGLVPAAAVWPEAS